MVVVGINLLIDKLEKWAFDLNDKPNRSSTDEKIIMALQKAKEKILKHYKKTNWTYCIALILDPRHKKEAFSFTNWGKELEETAIKEFENIYRNSYFYNVKEIESCGNVSNSNMEPSTSGSKNDDDLDFGQIFNISKQNASSLMSITSWRQEIDQYFSDSRAEENTDILDWWHKHQISYPILSKMARDVLSTTATSVPAERLFSKASLVIRKHRNRLNSESARCLLCLNSWESLRNADSTKTMYV